MRNILSLLATLILCLTALPAWALSIENVRFGEYSDKIRLVLDLDQTSDFRAFMLPDPYRMVIDLPSFTWNAGEVQKPQAAGILATRQGNLEPGISRIVFDLNRPVAIQSAFILKRNNAQKDRLVIDFANVSQSVFNKTRSKTFGTLKNPAVASAPQPPVSTAPKPRGEKPLIIIDPGHGGVDPGAIGANGVYEKHVALKLSKELKKQLLSSGKYRVKMTREDDRFIKLGNRVKYARNHAGDLFISVHADSLRNPKVSGASVYTLSEKASDAQTARLAARENKADLIAGLDLDVEDEEVANILLDLSMRDTMNQSKFFANTLVDSFNTKSIRLLQRPHRFAGFAVLKSPDIPSVLVEAGFMSNKAEAAKLNTSSHRQKIAKALKHGVDRYFAQVAKNQRM